MCSAIKSILLMLLLMLNTTTRASGQTDDIVKNKAVVRGYLQDLVNDRNWDTWNRYFASTVIFNGTEMNRDGLRQVLNDFLQLLPDFRLNIEEQIAERNVVFTRVTMHGTHDQKEVRFWGVAVDKIVNGKIVDMWHVVDQLGMLQQTVGLPAQGAAQK